jgi:hypothetical protein
MKAKKKSSYQKLGVAYDEAAMECARLRAERDRLRASVGSWSEAYSDLARERISERTISEAYRREAEIAQGELERAKLTLRSARAAHALRVLQLEAEHRGEYGPKAKRAFFGWQDLFWGWT